ncbi:PDR/VanB family oxidoreductase [soil metagenome]
MMSRNPVTLRVREAEWLAPTLKRLVLEHAEGAVLPIAGAGAHISLTLGDGDGPRLRNSYSLVSARDDGSRYELIVRRVEGSRGGSAFVHDRLAVGSMVEATAPHNLFPLMSHARKHLLIGGGIGITPLMAFVPALRERGAALELHQIASVGEAPLFETMLGVADAHDLFVHAGRHALDLAALLARQPLGTHVYVCGPAALMDRVETLAADLGWPAGNVHREDFGAAGGDPFTVTLAKSAITLAVGAEQSMLEAIEAADVDARSLCRGGVCGECITRVIDGTPEHRDHFLTEEEKASNTLVMPCVSRARGELVLDL